MKVLLITFLLASSFSFIHAQTGIYNTYADYENGNIMEYPANSGTISKAVGGKFKLTFKDESNQKITYKLGEDEMWGFQFEKLSYRLDEKNIPFLIVDVGDLIVYPSYTTMRFPKGDDLIYKILPGEPIKASLGFNGKMEKLTKVYLMDVFRNDPQTLAALKKVKSKPYALFEFLINKE